MTPTSPIYLDANATTPVDPRVVEAMLPYLTTHFGNPASRAHAFGRKAAEAVALGRMMVAALLGAGEDEITGLIAKYNLLALPVVDDKNVLHGIITVDDAIDLVLPLAWKKRLPRIFH